MVGRAANWVIRLAANSRVQLRDRKHGRRLVHETFYVSTCLNTYLAVEPVGACSHSPSGEPVGLLEPTLLSGAWRGRRPSVNAMTRSHEVSGLIPRQPKKYHTDSAGRSISEGQLGKGPSENRGKRIEGDRGAREAPRPPSGVAWAGIMGRF